MENTKFKCWCCVTMNWEPFGRKRYVLVISIWNSSVKVNDSRPEFGPRALNIRVTHAMSTNVYIQQQVR
jgi:hypothetical protein